LKAATMGSLRESIRGYIIWSRRWDDADGSRPRSGICKLIVYSYRA